MTTEKSIQNKTRKFTISDCIFIAILVLLPFIHVCVGVELSDTAYSLGNYENMESMNLTWTLATFWSNCLGRLMTMLPFGNLWIGMKAYTTLVVSVTAVVSYCAFRTSIPKAIAFVGEVFAICLCWCPTTILYNYLTYFLFTATTIVLIISLEKESKIGMMAAGVILAFNVFVRFPNVTETALIVLVWLDCVMNKRKFKSAAVNTLVCVGGFLLGVAINVGLLGIMYGFDSIPNMISSLFAMTNENSTYTPKEMVLKIFRNYYQYYFKSYILIVGISVGCFFASTLLKKHWAKIAIMVIQFILYGGFLVWAVRNSVFSFRYHEYSSMYFWLVVFLIMVNVFSIWTLLRKRISHIHKLTALACLVIIWITPLGSNNGLYSSMNNLFLVAPFTIFMIWNELFKGRNFFELLDLETKYSMVSTRITVIFLSACILIQGTLFGFVFVFRDSGFPFNNFVKIEGNERLAGMHTNAENKALIEELTKYVEENSLGDKKAIFYGEIPGLEYILKMPCAISHTWPDLDSFTVAEFSNDINALEDPPVIFINKEICPDIFNLEEDSSEKLCCLSEYMNNNEYKLVVRIQKIEVYVAN